MNSSPHDSPLSTTIMEKAPLLDPINVQAFDRGEKASNVKTVAIVILSVICVGLFAGVTVTTALLLKELKNRPEIPSTPPTSSVRSHQRHVDQEECTLTTLTISGPH